MNSAPVQFEDINLLETKLQEAKLPPELKAKALSMVERLSRIATTQGFSQEYDSVSRYLDWVVSVPWFSSTEDILSLPHAKQIMDSRHHGLEKVKERIYEYISVATLKRAQQVDNETIKAPSFLLLGLVGTGKTTMGYSIAEALGRKFGRIPMGGMGDALQLRGRSRAYSDAEPGQIIKTLRRTSARNPVILLDEIDRVSEQARSDIMGVLVELLDPEQNRNFLDHFLDYPIDLSEVLFVATANNTTHVATAVLDRLEVLEMPTYSDEQKIIIAKSYILPRELHTAGLSAQDLAFEENVWPHIVRPLGFDGGIRTLDRTISAITRKVAKQKVEGAQRRITIADNNLKEYIETWR